MKKVLFMLIVAVVFVSAQVWAADEGPTFGVKAGLNIANFSGKDAKNDAGESPDSRMGAVFGGFVEYPIGPMLSFQGEILYSMKGAKETCTEMDIKYETTMKIAYLEIPMLLKANLPMGDKVKPHVFAGPAIAFKMSGKFEEEGGGETTKGDIEDLKGTDIGLVMGAGFGFPMGSRMISLEARYDLGLTKIDDSAGKADVKNKAISILVGIAF